MNRQNLQSADPRKATSSRNAMPFNNSGLAGNESNENNTDEFVSADLNMAMAVNNHLNQIGHDQVNLETQSRDEIFQVNNLIN